MTVQSVMLFGGLWLLFVVAYAGALIATKSQTGTRGSPPLSSLAASALLEQC
jgi:hypothetical protein